MPRTLLEWQALACVIHYPACRTMFEARWFSDPLAGKFIAEPPATVAEVDDEEQVIAMMSEEALPAEKNAQHIARRMLKRWTDNEFARRVRRIG